ncbi:hypothetical protein JCM8547_005304 [Rhodosporidiobolus lusitaniae]
MFATTLLLTLLATVVFARPGSEDYGRSDDSGKDIFLNNEASTSDNQEEVSYKEVCYRNLYADIEKFKKETEKEIKISDDDGKDVFFFDSFKKDEDDVEFYYREFCYKDFSFDKHDDDESRQTVLDVSKRSLDQSSLDGSGLGDSSFGTSGAGSGFGDDDQDLGLGDEDLGTNDFITGSDDLDSNTIGDFSGDDSTGFAGEEGTGKDGSLSDGLDLNSEVRLARLARRAAC